VLMGPGAAWLSRIFIMVDDMRAVMVLGSIILATPTPGFRSLGSARPSCSALWKVYALRPRLICHKCATDRVVREPLMCRSSGVIGHERYTTGGVRRS
jgi:hypothetical protein